MRPAPNTRPAFTLIELLVVIAIIAVIVALVMPALNRSRDMASRMECESRLARVAAGLFVYHDANLVLPPGTVSGVEPVVPAAGEPQFAWTTRILRQLDMPQTYAAVDFSTSVYAPENDRLHELRLQPLTCPVGDPRDGVGYVGLQHHEPKGITSEDSGLFFNKSRVDLLAIPDGRSSTLMVAETAASAPVSWASGTRSTLRYARLGDADAGPGGQFTAADVRDGNVPEPDAELLERASLSSRHGDYAMAAMAGGRVTALSYRMDRAVLEQIANRDDREPLGGFE